MTNAVLEDHAIGRRRSGGPPSRSRILLALSIALLLQAALLGPLIWSSLGGDVLPASVADAPEPWVLPLDLTPRHPAPRSEPANRDPTPIAVSPQASPMAQTAPIRADPHEATESAAPADARWRLTPSGAAEAHPTPGHDVCRDLSNFRAWQAAGCRERGPPPRPDLRASGAAEVARPEARRGRAPGETADDQFVRQIAANQAWRDYTRGEGAYPGLRSLLRDH